MRNLGLQLKQEAGIEIIIFGAGKVVAAPEVGSPVTDASADCSQLPSGMTRASSRMKRSQSNRLAATSATDWVRVTAIWAKSV